MSNHNDPHKKNKTSLQKQHLSRRNPFVDYLIRVTEGTLKIFLTAVFAMSVSTGFLYLFRLFWLGYLSVPVGQKFLLFRKTASLNSVFNPNVSFTLAARFIIFQNL